MPNSSSRNLLNVGDNSKGANRSYSNNSNNRPGSKSNERDNEQDEKDGKKHKKKAQGNQTKGIIIFLIFMQIQTKNMVTQDILMKAKVLTPSFIFRLRFITWKTG